MFVCSNIFRLPCRQQLFLERESSGAVQLSQVSSERLLAELVGQELARRKAAGELRACGCLIRVVDEYLRCEGTYKGKYSTICHFFGYQVCVWLSQSLLGGYLIFFCSASFSGAIIHALQL
jgi:hypothetical protein